MSRYQVSFWKNDKLEGKAFVSKEFDDKIEASDFMFKTLKEIVTNGNNFNLRVQIIDNILNQAVIDQLYHRAEGAPT